MAAPAVVFEGATERLEAFQLLKARLNGRPSSLPIESLLPTGIPELDRVLGGGFPPGIVATLEGETGRWSLAAGLIAKFSRCSLVAILDDGGLYPPALAEAGVPLERVMILRLRCGLGSGQARKELAVARAADILLRSRICRLVLMPAVALRDVVWERLAKLAHSSGALLIVVAAHAGAALSAVSGVRLHCALERAIVQGRGLWGIIAGFELCVDVRKHKHTAAGANARMTVKNASLH